MANSALTRAFDNDWIGPAVVSGLAVAVISFFQPSFLTPFNIFVLLSAIAVNMLVALGQLVIIGIGQMNLALGAIGGLVAISFAAMMELWGCPPVLAVRLRARHRRAGGHGERLCDRAHRHHRPSSSRWPACRSSRASTSASPRRSPSTACRKA